MGQVEAVIKNLGIPDKDLTEFYFFDPTGMTQRWVVPTRPNFKATIPKNHFKS